MASNLLKSLLGMNTGTGRQCEAMSQGTGTLGGAGPGQYTAIDNAAGTGYVYPGQAVYMNQMNQKYASIPREEHYSIFDDAYVSGDPNTQAGMNEPISACALLWITKFGSRWVSSKELLEKDNRHFAAYARRLQGYNALEATTRRHVSGNNMDVIRDVYVRLKDTWEMALGYKPDSAHGAQ